MLKASQKKNTTAKTIHSQSLVRRIFSLWNVNTDTINWYQQKFTVAKHKWPENGYTLRNVENIYASHSLSLSENRSPGCWSEQPFRCISTLGIWTLPSQGNTNVPFVLKADESVHLLLVVKYFTPSRPPPPPSHHGDAFHFTCINNSLSVCNYIWCCTLLLLWICKISWLSGVLKETAAVCVRVLQVIVAAVCNCLCIFIWEACCVGVKCQVKWLEMCTFLFNFRLMRIYVLVHAYFVHLDATQMFHYGFI